MFWGFAILHTCATDFLIAANIEAPVHKSPTVPNNPNVPLLDKVSETTLDRYSLDTGKILITESTTTSCSDGVEKKYPIIEIPARANGKSEKRVQ